MPHPQSRYSLIVAAQAALLCVLPLQAAAQSSTLTGEAVSISPDGEKFVVPGATVTLVSVDELDPEAAHPTAETNEVGVFRFPNVDDGCYQLLGRSPGLQGTSDIFCLPMADGLSITLRLEPEVVVESIDVTATAIGLNPEQTSATESVGTSPLEHAPKMNKQFQDVMPLLPGVYKGPEGELNMSGARTSETGARFNGMDITDPVSGTSPFSLPLGTVASVNVLSNPYDAQYGGFAGAVSTVNTKAADLTDYNFAIQDFVPRPRRTDGSIVGLEAWGPRLTVSGPIRKGKLAFLHSTEYLFVRFPQQDANLPPLARDTEREAFTMYNQFDIQHSVTNRTSVGLLIYPAKINFHGLNAFNVQESTPDLRRRGYLASFQNRYDFGAGAALTSKVSYQKLDKDVKPRGYDPYNVGLEKALGSFFNREGRSAIRRFWSEEFSFKPFTLRGTHQFRTGLEVTSQTFHGSQLFNPVTWLGAGERPVLRADFGPAASLRGDKRDYAGYVHDHWSFSRSLTLDLGFRFERDSIVRDTNPGFRAGFAYELGKDARTVLRGGAGLFYNRTNLIVTAFPELPSRTETGFDATGNIVSELTFENRLRGPFRNARSLGWNLQLDRQVFDDLFVRAGYQQRQTRDNWVVDREENVGAAGVSSAMNYFTLASDGRDTYREWQFTVRYRLPRNGQVTGSYVRSAAVGDLNDLGAIYGATPAELIRDNQRSLLDFDAPHRFVIWSDLGFPHDIRFVPFLELRSGFPYSLVDEGRGYFGPANRAGRFPLYQSLDAQLTKRIAFWVFGRERVVRFGVRFFNVLNSFNPNDVQNNIASPYFGTFYRGQKRRIRFMFELGN